MKSLSLRMRLTLVTTGILALLALLLTVTSVKNAGEIFVAHQNESFSAGEEEYRNLAEASATNMGAASEEFRDVSVLLMVLVTVLGGVLAYFVLGIALRPVKTLSTQIRQVTEHALNVRIHDLEAGDEISELACSFNQMIARLEAAFETQRRFASAAAHELKTPLASIKTNLDVLRYGETGRQEMDQVFVVVQEQTARMIQLVDGLFLTAASASYEFCDRVSLDRVLETVLQEEEGAVAEKGLSVTLRQEPIMTTANEGMLHRAFANLVENAIKYNTVGGHIEILITREQDRAHVRISNTGLGIPPANLPHIFEPFYRVDESRSRKTAGAGLGLAIVKDTIERHGGTVQLSSVEGLGTVCQVMLPILTG